MAYNTGDRFPPLPYPYRFFEPGAYQNDGCRTKANKAPFLSKDKRNTQSGPRIWTHAIYHADPGQKIPNCTSLMSKTPRFPYEALSKEDIEAILCRCGLQNECECPDENEQEEYLNCQAKIHKRLFKGPPPRAGSQGISVPSRRHNGFEQMPDGTFKRIYTIESNLGPPFYDAVVHESTAFYRGCKWGQWRSTRNVKGLEKRPGPADYTIERLPTLEEICAEKVREQKRKHSKQIRYIEMIQRKNFLEGRPGPSHYSPNYDNVSNLKYLGAKAPRFPVSNETEGPGPAAYWIKRHFDLPEPPTQICQARLPEPSFFGIKAKRFKPPKEEGASPATYSPNDKQCHILNCSPPPFGSSAKRFKEVIFEDYEDEDEDQDENTHEICPKLTWEFKSKTIRMKPLEKKQFEQSPADLPMGGIYPKRKSLLQYFSPFGSSEGRFQPWNDWLSVFGRLKTPGPGYYNIEKNKCTPAVFCGPMYRAERFPASTYETPAPNEYQVDGGVETILATHNERLKQNMKNQHKFHWESPNVVGKLSWMEKETLILDKAIAALDVGMDTELNNNNKEVSDSIKRKEASVTGDKPKLLHYFMYRHQVKPGF